MLENRDRLLFYLDALVNSVFKILPLYEERNDGIQTYIESLLFELYGLDKVFDIKDSYEYVSVLSILESIKEEVAKENSKKRVIKREVFKCINIIKNTIKRLEKGG